MEVNGISDDGRVKALWFVSLITGENGACPCLNVGSDQSPAVKAPASCMASIETSGLPWLVPEAVRYVLWSILYVLILSHAREQESAG